MLWKEKVVCISLLVFSLRLTENLNEYELPGRDESDICLGAYSKEVRVDDASRTIGSLSECLKIGWVRMDGCFCVWRGALE